MIRSAAVGFAFVSLRLLRVPHDWFFPFIEDPVTRTTVRECVCFIVPLLAVEIRSPIGRRSSARRTKGLGSAKLLGISNQALVLQKEYGLVSEVCFQTAQNL